MILQKNKSKNKIAFHKTGKGDPVILLHGLGLRSESWIEQINFLKKNYTIYSIDLPGHGKSSLLSQKKINLKSYSDEIIKFIKNNNILKPVLVGHSLGSLITIEIAGQAPNLLKAGVAVSPIYQRSKKALRAVQQRAKEIKVNPTKKIMIHDLIYRWFNNSKSKNISKASKLIEKLLRLNFKDNLKGYTLAYDVFSNLEGNSSNILKKIKVPMFYITGDKDPNSTPFMTKKLAKNQLQQYTIIKGARHILQLTHAKQFNFYLNKFIKGLN